MQRLWVGRLVVKLSLEKFQAEERYGKDSPQAKALGTQMQALQQQLDQEFGLGSEKGMAIRAVTAALQSAVQQDKAGAITALASPYLNREIHKLTEGDSTKEKAANLMAHALLSAVEFQVTGKDPLTGAMAGVTGEATAQYLTKALYNKAPSELTASEKETISSLSQLAGGLAGAFTAKANGSSESQGGSFLSGVAGAETAKRAVENNYLSSLDVEHFIQELEKAQKEGRDTKPIIEKYQKISAENRQELLACNGNVLCESGHLYQMNAGAEEVERNLGFFSRMTVPYPNNLNENNRILLSIFVEQENANSFNQLSSGTKFGLSAIELGAAIGGTGLITKDSLGKFKLSNANANSKLPVVGKTENYENQTSKIHISSGAENVALYTKLKSNLIGKEIGGGHAFSKHIIKQGEFRGLNIATQEQFERHIENVVNNYTSFKELSNGRVAYWHQETGTVVIRNPKAKDGGTAFQPRDGRKYFDDKLK
ncbi:VENN motif pre-toxin domain-containing protein [Avibacterium paragallinarum]|uniref:VENN motif-containing domain-containing protein n=1 Tax=Avibacterium paragallinarum TaxID=728 RepID=A0AAE5TIJ5_AVIPA|nr:VENN motif pre-toxin domain-containing protein [Avibacterium paragallinarum]MEE3607469.1 VENN motif pre-toxin domain-containing protein [Avibacterium paragallinarum]MEE3622279.1 VENN motif pre-toxin domain-containing protein [Avibacterium paragallinarum]MEE3682053.1 VENN motif pre-toxin domain-containing protein [Avibacterium paragallinarum]MEE4386766.1 VENN motif pre-toxin domain-containing protein [Avibacterium paragallinarum]PXZ39870.1 hypothetical protein DM482_03820 [Avibacterium parag